MVGRDGVGNLLKDRGLARTRRSDDDAARAFADGRDEINDPRFENIRTGFETELLNGINAGEILKAHGLRVILEHHVVDLFHRLELRTGAAMRWLGRAHHETAFAQKIALDRIGRDEDVRRLGMKMVGRRAQEAEAFLGDFEIPGAVVAPGGSRRGGGGGIVVVFTTHKLSVCCEGSESSPDKTRY